MKSSVFICRVMLRSQNIKIISGKSRTNLKPFIVYLSFMLSTTFKDRAMPFTKFVKLNEKLTGYM